MAIECYWRYQLILSTKTRLLSALELGYAKQSHQKAPYLERMDAKVKPKQPMQMMISNAFPTLLLVLTDRIQ